LVADFRWVFMDIAYYVTRKLSVSLCVFRAPLQSLFAESHCRRGCCKKTRTTTNLRQMIFPRKFNWVPQLECSLTLKESSCIQGSLLGIPTCESQFYISIWQKLSSAARIWYLLLFPISNFKKPPLLCNLQETVSPPSLRKSVHRFYHCILIYSCSNVCWENFQI
jgi:hypothetical protein